MSSKALILKKLQHDMGTFTVNYREEDQKVLFGMLLSLNDVTDLILELNSRYDVHIEHDFVFATGEYNEWNKSHEVFAAYDIESFQHILKDYPYIDRTAERAQSKDEGSDILEEQLDWFGSD